MGPNWKLRRPFIWQDEMMEVRELFRRVDRVRNSGFTGFSTWESPPPSADTLSRNRLRRRRALCSLELSHLNYKEAPFESLNHLQNIRGMCTRIQRQDYPMERKKKDVDLISRPPLLRRSITSTSVERRGRKRPPFEVGRPYSAPPIIPIQSISSNSTCDLRSIPLQYATPKLTTLYDITQKSSSTSRSSTSRSSTHKSFNMLPPVLDQCPSTTSSKHRIANNYSNPCCTLISEQNLPGTLKSIEDVELFEQIGLNLNSDMSKCKDHQSFTRPIKSLKNSNNVAIEPSTNDYDLPQTTNSKSKEKLNNSTYCAWSTIDDTTTSFDIYSTSIINYKPQTNKLYSSLEDTNVTSSFKGTEKEKPSFIQPISDYYCSEKRNCFESKNSSRHSYPSNTPNLFTKSTFDNLKASTCHQSLHEMPSISPLDVNHIGDDEGEPSKMKGGYNAIYSLHEMNLTKNQICLNDMEKFIEKRTSSNNIKFDSTSNSIHSTLGENLGFVGQSSTLTTESQWLTSTLQKSSHKNPLHLELERIGNNSLNIENGKDEKIVNQETTIDDPNVLIKHSSDPYSDFRLSMVTMIEEEGLQNRQGELEELFQYYLDLNPKVHHDVLDKVIQDIRTDYLLKTF